MAKKEQSISVLSEGNKIYVTVENPTAEVKKALLALVNNVSADLTNILKPVGQSDEEKIEHIEQLSAKASESVPMAQTMATEMAAEPIAQPMETVAPTQQVAQPMVEETVAPIQEPTPIQPVVQNKVSNESSVFEYMDNFDINTPEAEKKRLLIRGLTEYVNNNYQLPVNQRRGLAFIYYANQEKQRELIKTINNAQFEAIWNQANLAQTIADYVGYSFPATNTVTTDGQTWV